MLQLHEFIFTVYYNKRRNRTSIYYIFHDLQLAFCNIL